MNPDPQRAREKYRHIAGRYDRSLGAVDGIRRQAVRRLGLGSGDIVLDIACGTGLSFPLLEEEVGPDGRIVGIDLSPEMLGKARVRVESAGWNNVTLIESAIEAAEIPVQADAVILNSVALGLSRLRPGDAFSTSARPCPNLSS